MADMSVSKPPPVPPPDDGKTRFAAGKRESARKRPPAKPAAKPGTAPSAPSASGNTPDPEHKLDLLV